MSTDTDTDVEYPYNTAQFTAKVGYTNNKTSLRYAKKLGLGVALGGRAGHRFNDADVQRLLEYLRPEPTVRRKRKGRRAA